MQAFLNFIINERKMMNRICLSILFLLVFSAATAQEKTDPRIAEVYIGEEGERVINDPDRMRDLKDILQNRLKVVYEPYSHDEKYAKLSSVGLLSVYNPGLIRDETIDPATFNPLKYDLNFFPRYTIVYRIDHTDYIIIIEPQQTPANIK